MFYLEVNTNSELVNSSSFDGLFERNAPRVWIDVEVGHSSCITRYTVFKLVVWGLKEQNIFFIRHTGSKKSKTRYSTYFTLTKENQWKTNLRVWVCGSHHHNFTPDRVVLQDCCVVCCRVELWGHQISSHSDIYGCSSSFLWRTSILCQQPKLQRTTSTAVKSQLLRLINIKPNRLQKKCANNLGLYLMWVKGHWKMFTVISYKWKHKLKYKVSMNC